MNEAHLEFSASPEWARLVEDELLPWVLDGYELRDDLLEVGPGPGLTTDVLRRKAARVTAVELDLDLEARLRAAGFTRARVAVMGDRLKFAATNERGYGPAQDGRTGHRGHAHRRGHRQ